jgi:acyl-CoA thioester hydrolase|tara:strand:+ start:2594 stop:2992 length:399 start_codon:yes stop_codon:yes gene_type:complete
MWTNTLQPRFSETDALGHVNNTVLPVWFEESRSPIFELFCPGMNVDDWHLIIAKIDVDFLAEIYYGKSVEIRTYMNKVGNSSMVVGHEAWQEEKMVAKGSAILVHFDHKAKTSKPISDDIRNILEQHLVTTE